jgi:site-specific recombinase XerD
VITLMSPQRLQHQVIPIRHYIMTDLVPVIAAKAALEQIERELERDPRLQSAHTRRAYRTDLHAFEAWRAGRPMTKGLVESYAVYLRAEDRSPNSINRALASVRWWARRLADLVYEEPLPKAKRDEIMLQATRVAGIRDVTGQREIRGRHVADAEGQALITACKQDKSPAGRRDAAMFALAWGTGMRRSEIAGLGTDDLKLDGGEVTIQVRGKGNKVRRAYLHGAGARLLKTWLAERGQQSGALFCRVRKGGSIVSGRALTGEALAYVLEKRSKEAGLAEHVSWHDFRRTFAGNLLDQGVDLVTVQKLLGHTSPTTTSNYDRRGDETKRRAASKIAVPTGD